MLSRKILRVFIFILLCACLFAVAPAALCQEPAQNTSTARPAPRDADTNLETQLYLIMATNRDVEDGKFPAALDPIVKRLRESLPFKHYTLAGSFLNRVRNFGHLDVSWVGGPFTNLAAPAGNPSFNQFGAIVTLAADNDGNPVVRLRDFTFGAKVPIITGGSNTSNASAAQQSFPTINYESVGLHTDLSIRENTAAIAGTLHVGPSGDAIVVAIWARRVN